MDSTVTSVPLPPLNTTCKPPYEDDQLPLVVLYSTVLAVGVPANLLTVYLTWLQMWRKNVLGVYLWSLSVCDLTYLCTLPLWTLYVGGGHRWPWGAAACRVTGYIFFTNMYVSIFLLCCISCDRYVAVAYAVESRGLRRQRLACLISAAVVLTVAAAHLPVFFMRERDVDGNNTHCFEPRKGSAAVVGFSYARFIVGFLVPLVLLAATNRAILANIQLSCGLQPEQKRRVRRLAVAVVALFLVCFGPYHIMLLSRAIVFHFPKLEEQHCLLERNMYTPYTISLGLCTFNSAANPILYVLSSDNIRKEVRRGLAAFSLRCKRGGGQGAAASTTSSTPTFQMVPPVSRQTNVTLLEPR